MSISKKHWILAAILFVAGATDAHVELETKLTDASFTPGQTIKLSWKSLIDHDPVGWHLQYSEDAGVNWIAIDEGLPLEQLTFDWLAPNIESSHMLVRIIQDNDKTEDYWDDSDEFTITKEEVTAIFDLDVVSIQTKTFPNPAIFEVELDLAVNHHADLTVSIYDKVGLLLKRWEQPNREAGEHIYKWPVYDVPAGTYFFEVRAGKFLRTHPFIVLH